MFINALYKDIPGHIFYSINVISRSYLLKFPDLIHKHFESNSAYIIITLHATSNCTSNLILQMATLRAKVDSFQDSGKLLEWAEALEIHQDPIVLYRLAILRSDRTGHKFLFAQYLIFEKCFMKDNL